MVGMSNTIIEIKNNFDDLISILIMVRKESEFKDITIKHFEQQSGKRLMKKSKTKTELYSRIVKQLHMIM
jgi:hypothetical protein